MKKKKFNTQRLFAIIALIAMVALFIASCVTYM
jgi:hypothetical protein